MLLILRIVTIRCGLNSHGFQIYVQDTPDIFIHNKESTEMKDETSSRSSIALSSGSSFSSSSHVEVKPNVQPNRRTPPTSNDQTIIQSQSGATSHGMSKSVLHESLELKDKHTEELRRPSHWEPLVVLRDVQPDGR